MQTRFLELLSTTILVAGCSSDARTNSTERPPQWAGSWLCNFMLVQHSGATTEFTTTYQASPVNTVVSGTALSIEDEEPDSEPQSWYCGFNYSVADAAVVLDGTPTCTSNTVVVLQSAAISMAPDGNDLTLQESGTENDHGQILQSTMSGVCARNE
jgi:hypothetical protein